MELVLLIDQPLNFEHLISLFLPLLVQLVLESLHMSFKVSEFLGQCILVFLKLHHRIRLEIYIPLEVVATVLEHIIVLFHQHC